MWTSSIMNLSVLSLVLMAFYSAINTATAANSQHEIPDPSKLRSISGKESQEARQDLFKSKNMLWLHLRSPEVLDHLYGLATSNKKIELDRVNSYHDMLNGAEKLKAEWEAKRAGYKRRIDGLTDLCNITRIRPIKIVEKNRFRKEIQELEAKLEPLDEKILKMQVILEYCSDSNNPCYEIKKSLSSQ